ncbi:MarR family winged helix-turn-helix transcriptional regulator [Brevibacillus fulvus]|uniref:MarR family 2-MHQ and catechol resistance regulon transcriptional repressor n=1 Tax=Brevibacillus fulvus TaxID=1125967 RepID=A0A938Y2B7_9BACL|nr:MarR family transcriptional regulator [Brevibacillus fulvus]MBM7589915.1 MarR family 2-MHQ and catechol resistance regulon transcriptional repressor [Brevibacillus fulvus]
MSDNTRETEQALHLYRVLSRSYQSVWAHSMRDIKLHGLHPTEFAVLELLYHKGPQPLQQIGNSILITSGSVTYVVDKLEKNGMLSRQPYQKDRRVIHADLTEKGRALLDQIFPEHAEAIRHALGGLEEQEKEQLIHLLKKMGLEAERRFQ